MTARTYPRPYWARTIHLLGDTHIGQQVGGSTVELNRRSKIVTDLARLNGTPYHRVQMGDLVENWSQPTYDTDAKAWMNSLSAVSTGTWDVVLGNHDLAGAGGTFRTADQWAAVYGYADQNWVRDLPFCRLVAVGQDSMANTTDPPIVLSQATLNWLDAQLGTTSLPCIVLCHAPLSGTVLGDYEAGEFSSNSAFFQVHCIDINTSDQALRDVLAAHSNVKAYVSGHTHSNIESTGFVTSLTLGGHPVACINTSSTWYTGPLPSGGDNWNDPIRTIYLTVLGSSLEVRFRNHGRGIWDNYAATARVWSMAF